jgi:hypothetical protein
MPRRGCRAGPARARIAADSFPIWSCSVWGLPCLRRYRRSGALLPHLFTLTPDSLRECSSRNLSRKTRAVYSLWHLPSLSLDAQVPDVIRHTALRSPDFPPPHRSRSAAAAVQSACWFDDTANRPAPHRVSPPEPPRLLHRLGRHPAFPRNTRCASIRGRRSDASRDIHAPPRNR